MSSKRKTTVDDRLQCDPSSPVNPWEANPQEGSFSWKQLAEKMVRVSKFRSETIVPGLVPFTTRSVLQKQRYPKARTKSVHVSLVGFCSLIDIYIFICCFYHIYFWWQVQSSWPSMDDSIFVWYFVETCTATLHRWFLSAVVALLLFAHSTFKYSCYTHLVTS